MIVGNQKMVQLRFGQCGVPVVWGILGPIVADGPQAGLWRPAAAAKTAANRAQSGAFAPINCLPFIDSLFAGSPIKHRVHRGHLLADSDSGSCRYRLRKGDWP
jgi:hypothetical protein